MVGTTCPASPGSAVRQRAGVIRFVAGLGASGGLSDPHRQSRPPYFVYTIEALGHPLRHGKVLGGVSVLASVDWVRAWRRQRFERNSSNGCSAAMLNAPESVDGCTSILQRLGTLARSLSASEHPAAGASLYAFRGSGDAIRPRLEERERGRSTATTSTLQGRKSGRGRTPAPPESRARLVHQQRGKGACRRVPLNK